MIRRTALAAGLLAVFVAACSSDEGAAKSGEEMVLYPTTKILDQAALALVTEVAADESMFTFRGSSPALDSVVVGDVIMGGVSDKTPTGVLRKVTNVTKTGGTVKLDTVRATLTDAIEQGHIRLPLTRLRKEGSTLVPKALHPLNDTPSLAFDQDFTLGINDVDLGSGVTGGASVGFGLGIDVDLTISLKEISGTAVLSGSQTSSVDIHAPVGAKFGKKVPLGEVKFPPIYFQVGNVPVVINSGLLASVGVEGTTSAQFDWSASEKAAVDVGIKIGTNGVDPIYNGGAEASADPIKIDGTAKVRGYAELKLEVGVNVPFVSSDFYVGAQGYVTLDVDSKRSADCYIMSRGVDAIYGVDVTVLGFLHPVSENSRSSIMDPKPFDQGACSNDPLAVTPWASVIGPSDYDTGPKLALLEDQSLLIGTSTAGNHAYVARLKPDGSPLWENAIQDDVVTVANVSPAFSGDGSSWMFGTSETRPILTHLGSDGSKTSTTLVTSPSKPSPDRALFVASKDGGVLMGGQALDATDTFVQWAAKVDATGKVVWAKSYGKLGEPRAIAEANDGGVLLVGDGTVNGGAATQVTRISPSGDVVFAKTYGEGRLFGVTAVSTGGLAATGATAGGGGGLVLRIADDGALTWGFAYKDTTPEKAEFEGDAIVERSDGLLVGGVRGFAGSADFWALQVSADGALGWSRTYGGAKSDEVKAIARTSDNGAVLLGETASFGGTTQLLAIRIPQSGAFQPTAGSGLATKNIDGEKQAVPGQPTTLNAVPSPMGAVSTPATEGDWPLIPATAKRTKL